MEQESAGKKPVYVFRNFTHSAGLNILFLLNAYVFIDYEH